MYVDDFDKCVFRNTKTVGIMWRKCHLKRKVVVERADIFTWRSRYLKEVQEYQDNGHLMFYVPNTWTESNIIFCKCWKEGEVMGIHTHVNSGNRLIMLHVGGISRFLLLCTSHLQGWTWSRRLPWTDVCNKFQDVGNQGTNFQISTSACNSSR